MSSHAKEITKFKDNIPKLLFLTTGKITKQFQETDVFVTRAKLEFEVEDKVFTFDFSTDDDKNIVTNFDISALDGENMISVEGKHDTMGPPLNNTIN
tara:strand:+ start:1058 stop:1348 length:291 start_codon:yes stop_codon:yes gene_type:complete